MKYAATFLMTLGFLVAAEKPVPEKEKPLTEARVSELRILMLTEQNIQSHTKRLEAEYQLAQISLERAKNESNAAHASICKEAGFKPETCTINMDKRVVLSTEPTPEKEKGK